VKSTKIGGISPFHLKSAILPKMP